MGRLGWIEGDAQSSGSKSSLSRRRWSRRRGSSLTWATSLTISSGSRCAPGLRPSGMVGSAGTEGSVGADMSAYLRDMRFFILSSTVDFRLVEGDFASFEALRLTGRDSEGRRERRDCILSLTKHQHGPLPPKLVLWPRVWSQTTPTPLTPARPRQLRPGRRPTRPTRPRRVLPQPRPHHPRIPLRPRTFPTPAAKRAPPRSLPSPSRQPGLPPLARPHPRTLPRQCKEDTGSRSPVRVCRLHDRRLKDIPHPRAHPRQRHGH